MTLETAVTGAPGEPELPAEQLERFLYEMAFIRRFEEKAGEMYTRGKIRGFLHLYTGQEACAVGAIHALEERDKVIAHYRDHGHAIAKGVDPKRVMAELYGRADGTSGGRGGSMHIYDTSKGMMGGYAIVTAHLPVAVGLGLASSMKGEGFVTLCIFGDGSVGEGEFHEALNLSVLWKVPVIFFCENNLYGMGVSFAESLSTEIPKLAAAYNMPAVSIDGMDVLEVHRETKKAVEHCRSGKGPYFIEAMTYRYRGHSMSDPELYRLKDEIEEYRRRDAIESLRLYMQERGLVDEQRWRQIEERVERDVEECVAFAEASPQPGIETLFEHVTKESGDD
ncbi:MAG: pyruvate dehydrogenase (acetyl-transferring) E1 component subunit alpha [Dehalococcoidia bacterium]|nr:pyruvate dehydrogenase (acetyl-transferring) E1 component subunit alpha [Chloroflexi bacterium CFX7]MCK6565164.1 pyruvate dehydrogenase (acetyl-transferring) E1 component subunit alpha [Dehalococcoidia bacterium]NUQ55457.1 pyruvate dehydrogenase (acetyl-transferring) E1 component subunit alpha [Dehalococcoidia bacterium]RIL04115.1 MAG: pyruvate dehydrogenase (acetyl-transferring) E1 component subunit alpha [bacterium]